MDPFWGVTTLLENFIMIFLRWGSGVGQRGVHVLFEL